MDIVWLGRGNCGDCTLVGGKGANLAEMSNLGVPVPPGFTISTQVCAAYAKRGRLSREVKADILTAL